VVEVPEIEPDSVRAAERILAELTQPEALRIASAQAA